MPQVSLHAGDFDRDETALVNVIGDYVGGYTEDVADS